MSWQPAREPSVETAPCPALELAIVPRQRDLRGGFEVRRVLPSAERRAIGPFVFFDQIGPTILPAGTGLDVRPHPHIGLATVTYLFSGEILHRDSIGTVQAIEPGAVNWMTAGRGIAHSERTPPALRMTGGPLSGIQAWVALPKRHEETKPAFSHHSAADLPVIEGSGARLRVIAGRFRGGRSPVPTFSDMFYVDAELEAKARVELSAEHEERALYIVEGAIAVAGEEFAPGRLLVFRGGHDFAVEAT